MTKQKNSKLDKRWTVYILECSDGSYYTGVTTDINKRIKAHNDKRGAKYTSRRTPVKLIVCRDGFTKREAYKLEKTIKRQKRNFKVKYLIGYDPK